MDDCIFDAKNEKKAQKAIARGGYFSGVSSRVTSGYRPMPQQQTASIKTSSLHRPDSGLGSQPFNDFHIVLFVLRYNNILLKGLGFLTCSDPHAGK